MVQFNSQLLYKYKPSDFQAFINLGEDISHFYKLLEEHRDGINPDSWFYLRNQWERLFFSIKHREMEGLNPIVADEMRYYFEELMYDD